MNVVMLPPGLAMYKHLNRTNNLLQHYTNSRQAFMTCHKPTTPQLFEPARDEIHLEFVGESIEIDLGLSPSDHDPCLWVCKHAETVLNRLWRRLTIDKLDVVLENQMRYSDLDLVGREESTWASMLAMAKGNKVCAGRDEEAAVLKARYLAAFEETVAVKDVGVFVKVLRPHTVR